MYQRILVPIDDGEISHHALDEAIDLARLTHGCLRLLHVIDDLSVALAADPCVGCANELLEGRRAAARKLLDRGVANARSAHVEAQSVLREEFEGAVHARVTEEANAWKADLIVLGTHGRRGFSRLMMGSNAERIVRSSKVPVLLVCGPRSTLEGARPRDAAGESALSA